MFKEFIRYRYPTHRCPYIPIVARTENREFTMLSVYCSINESDARESFKDL
jgi:hypothetical protein